jgi:hypothetical protein
MMSHADDDARKLDFRHTSRRRFPHNAVFARRKLFESSRRLALLDLHPLNR